MTGLDDLPDGAYWQMHVEAVDAYNEWHGINIDWYDIQSEYITWSNAQK
jgi:hypothetical protein